MKEQSEPLPPLVRGSRIGNYAYNPFAGGSASGAIIKFSGRFYKAELWENGVAILVGAQRLLAVCTGVERPVSRETRYPVCTQRRQRVGLGVARPHGGVRLPFLQKPYFYPEKQFTDTFFYDKLVFIIGK